MFKIDELDFTNGDVIVSAKLDPLPEWAPSTDISAGVTIRGLDGNAYIATTTGRTGEFPPDFDIGVGIADNTLLWSRVDPPNIVATWVLPPEISLVSQVDSTDASQAVLRDSSMLVGISYNIAVSTPDRRKTYAGVKCR